MMSICPICGTRRVIYWPHLWPYKSKGEYLCSENCLVAFDTKEFKKRFGLIEPTRKKGKGKMKKLTLQQKKKAVQIAIAGGNPLSYLRELGIKNPTTSWSCIKGGLAKSDPETFKKIQDNEKPRQLTAKVEGPVIVDGPAEIPEAVPAEVETPERFQYHPSPVIRAIEEKQGKPIDQIIAEKQETMYQGHEVLGYKVTSIQHEKLGEFYHDWKHNKIDWRAPGGEEISMSPTCWWDLAEAVPEIMAIIGGDPHEKSDS